MAKQWLFRGFDSDAIQSLARQANIETVVAQLLYQRGITDSTYIASFLDPKFSELREPDSLPNIAIAAERIVRAVRDHTPITIYGDYDADGMSGTAILYNCLKLLDADVQYFIPNRLEDSYGLSCEALDKLRQRGRSDVREFDVFEILPTERVEHHLGNAQSAQKRECIRIRGRVRETGSREFILGKSCAVTAL